MSKHRTVIDAALAGAGLVRQSLDALYNAITGLGAGQSFGVELDQYVPYNALLTIYRQETYARRAVDLPVKDAWAKGYRIIRPDGRDEFYSPEWAAERKRLKLQKLIPRAVQYARMGRAAYLVAITLDGSSPDRPLDLATLKRVDQFVLLSAGECRPHRLALTTGPGSDPNDDAPADFAAPETYLAYIPRPMQTALKGVPAAWAKALAGQTPIHASRIIRVVNGNLTLSESYSQPEEGESLIGIIFRVLAQHATLDAAAATLATEMRQHIVTIENMQAIKASNQSEAFTERMRLFAQSKTVANLILLGKGEKFESATGSVGGFDTLSQTTRDALCAATGIPESIFFPKASGGMGGEPGIDAEVYVALLRDIWDDLLGPAVADVRRILVAQKNGPWRGVGYKQAVEVIPRELRELKPKERATLRLLNAQADSIYLGAGTVAREYVNTRFQDPTGWRENLPEYDPEKWPLPPLPDPKPAGGGTPNAAGKNAPGQKPATPGEAVGTSQGSASGTSVEAANGTQTSAGDRADADDGPGTRAYNTALTAATVQALLDDR